MRVFGQITNGSIVFRMRLCAGLIALLVIGLVVIAERGLGRVVDSGTRLTSGAVPSVLRAETFSRGLNELAVEMAQARSVSTNSDRAALVGRISAIMDRLQATPDLDPDMAILLRRIEISARSELERATAKNRSTDAQARDVDEVQRVVARTRNVLQPQLAAALARIDEHVARGGVTPSVLIGSKPSKAEDPETEAPETEASNSNASDINGSDLVTLGRDIGWLGDLMDLRSGLGYLEGQIASASRGDAMDLERADRQIIQTMATLDAGLGGLVDLPDHDNLTLALERLRNLALGEQGVVERQRQFLSIEAERQREAVVHHTLMDEISRMTAVEVEAAKTNIMRSTDEVAETLVWTSTLLRLSGVAVLLLIGAVVFFVIERQMIARLARLSDAVRRMAAGDHDVAVGITGKDELGQMAAAVDVFKDNARELIRSNQELSRFAYAASHDLRSPLRAIHNLAHWAIEDAGDDMPDSSRRHLTMLIQRADRLARLLGSLLDYSLVGRETASIAAVDLDEMAANLLGITAPDGGFTISVEAEDPVIVTYETPLRQVLMNLIGNAIKHHDRDEGAIRIVLSRSATRMRLAVSDDGPGIPREYHRRIFGLFQTLRPRDEVEGSGMGLSIVRKLVEHYKGTIKVASAPRERRGTTFFFDWPLADLSPAQEEAWWTPSQDQREDLAHA